jgi:hypothetical protein
MTRHPNYSTWNPRGHETKRKGIVATADERALDLITKMDRSIDSCRLPLAKAAMMF